LTGSLKFAKMTAVSETGGGWGVVVSIEFKIRGLGFGSGGFVAPVATVLKEAQS
jgi:hypothetical protein